MKRKILVRGARQLLTLHGSSGLRRGSELGNVGLIEDGSILIVDGAIASVGPTRRIENLSEAKKAEEINAAGKVVMPGWVDSHLVLTPLPSRTLGYLPQGFEGALTPSQISENAEQYLRNSSPGRLSFLAARTLDTALRHGTISLEVKSGYGISESLHVKAMRSVRSTSHYCNMVQSFVVSRAPKDFRGREDQYVDYLCLEFLPKLKTRRWSQTIEISCAPATFTMSQARKVVNRALLLGFTAKLISENLTLSGVAGLCHEVQIRAISGMTQCDKRDAELLSRTSTIATLLPGPAFRGWTDVYPPARMLIEAGVAVSLGSATIEPGIPAPMNMQGAVTFACHKMQMSIEEAIAAATINGAHAISLANTTGSLEFGKDADVMMLSVPDYREIPHQLGTNIVEMCMRKGEIVYKEGPVKGATARPQP